MRKLFAVLSVAGLTFAMPGAALAAPPDNRPPDNRPPQEDDCDLGVIVGDETICLIEG